jgi:hypothetical protein
MVETLSPYLCNSNSRKETTVPENTETTVNSKQNLFILMIYIAYAYKANEKCSIFSKTK